MARKEIVLGSEVRDRVTGFKGIAVAKVEYINGCIQYGIRGKILKDGKFPDAIYIDEEHLEATGKSVKIEKKETGAENEKPSGNH
jgi:hypothetical protein